MINLLLPFGAIAFAFIVSVLIDFRKRQFNSQNLINHSTRMGIYLASIAILELVAKTEPALAKYVLYIALVFSGSEILNTAMLIKAALGANDPLVNALNAANQAVQGIASQAANTALQQATQAAQQAAPAPQQAQPAQNTQGGAPNVDTAPNRNSSG